MSEDYTISLLTTVFYTAAHGGFAGESVPLGGGAAVCDHLVAEWERTRPFDFRLLTPALLGPGAPTGTNLVSFTERQYADFCRKFERAVTEEILRHDPAGTVVLSNDVAEGPDFRRLAAGGFHIYTIYHVDVVDYVAAIYLRSRIRPETLVRWQARLGNWWMPEIARLIFEKQRDSLACSRAVIVPSEAMREVLLRCYPREAAGKVQVVPWGVWDAGPPASPKPLRREFGMPDDALCLLTLSRISPEKGQDLLLEALLEWERRGDLPERPLWLFICGEAAYMQGRRFLDHLHRLAARLRRVRVVFPGYVTGERKQAFFALADVYVFPSRHESYGLTLLEALQAGLPAVCLDHHGAREVMRPDFGEIVPATVPALRDALARVLSDDQARRRQSAAARAYAAGQRFKDSAARLAELLLASTAPSQSRLL